MRARCMPTSTESFLRPSAWHWKRISRSARRAARACSRNVPCWSGAMRFSAPRGPSNVHCPRSSSCGESQNGRPGGSGRRSHGRHHSHSRSDSVTTSMTSRPARHHRHRWRPAGLSRLHPRSLRHLWDTRPPRAPPALPQRSQPPPASKRVRKGPNGWGARRARSGISSSHAVMRQGCRARGASRCGMRPEPGHPAPPRPRHRSRSSTPCPDRSRRCRQRCGRACSAKTSWRSAKSRRTCGPGSIVRRRRPFSVRIPWAFPI